jgi:hypothetical protein
MDTRLNLCTEFCFMYTPPGGPNCQGQKSRFVFEFLSGFGHWIEPPSMHFDGLIPCVWFCMPYYGSEVSSYLTFMHVLGDRLEWTT